MTFAINNSVTDCPSQACAFANDSPTVGGYLIGTAEIHVPITNAAAITEAACRQPVHLELITWFFKWRHQMIGA